MPPHLDPGLHGMRKQTTWFLTGPTQIGPYRHRRSYLPPYLTKQFKVRIVRAPAIRKMVIGGRKVAQISFIPSCRGTHWKLENQCLVNFKSCKSVEIMGCILLHMTFCNVILENEGVHTKLVISLLFLILHH